MNYYLKTLMVTLILLVGLNVTSIAQTHTVFGANTISNTGQVGANDYDTVSYSAGIEFDEFSFINETASGTNDIVVKVQAVDSGNFDLQAGLMVRTSLNDGAPFQAVFVDGHRTVRILERWTQDGFTYSRDLKILKRTDRVWLRIEKRGSLNPIYYKFSNKGSWLHLDNSYIRDNGGVYYAGMMTAGGASNDSVAVHYKKFKITSTSAPRLYTTLTNNTVYPNPSINTISTKVDVGQYIITNLTGKTVLKGSSTIKIDITELPTGMYILKSSVFITRFNKL